MQNTNVVIGLLFNRKGEILIALRPPHVVAPGLWEFPGGKAELNETLEAALVREYQEEIGISLETINFLFSVVASEFLTLHVFQIHAYTGEPRGCENQEIRFVSIDTLTDYQFPSANADIVAYLMLGGV